MAPRSVRLNVWSDRPRALRRIIVLADRIARGMCVSRTPGDASGRKPQGPLRITRLLDPDRSWGDSWARCRRPACRRCRSWSTAQNPSPRSCRGYPGPLSRPVSRWLDRPTSLLRLLLTLPGPGAAASAWRVRWGRASSSHTSRCIPSSWAIRFAACAGEGSRRRGVVAAGGCPRPPAATVIWWTTSAWRDRPERHEPARRTWPSRAAGSRPLLPWCGSRSSRSRSGWPAPIRPARSKQF
jgi:hypothetical protein